MRQCVFILYKWKKNLESESIKTFSKANQFREKDYSADQGKKVFSPIIEMPNIVEKWDNLIRRSRAMRLFCSALFFTVGWYFIVWPILSCLTNLQSEPTSHYRKNVLHFFWGPLVEVGVVLLMGCAFVYELIQLFRIWMLWLQQPAF